MIEEEKLVLAREAVSAVHPYYGGKSIKNYVRNRMG